MISPNATNVSPGCVTSRLRTWAHLLPMSRPNPSLWVRIGNRPGAIVAGLGVSRSQSILRRTRAINFLATRRKLPGQTHRDSADVLPRFGLHDPDNGALDVPDQRNVFTFAENEDERRH